MHWPCAAHVGHAACESVPEHDAVAGRGVAGAAMNTGAAVGGPGAAAAEQQLRAQFDSIHGREVLVHIPCDAQAAHEACKRKRINRRLTDGHRRLQNLCARTSESVPQLLVAGGGMTLGVAMTTGAAVRGGVTTGAHDGLQLRVLPTEVRRP